MDNSEAERQAKILIEAERQAKTKEEIDRYKDVKKPDSVVKSNPVAPVEIKKPEPPKFTKVAIAPPSEDDKFSPYPFHDLKPGEGFFVADDDVKGNTLNAMRSHAFHANKHFSTPVHDINGDEVWENVIIHGLKRNPKAHYDQFGNLVDEFELDSAGEPFKTTEERSVPKVVRHRHFSVKEVAKDDVISGTTKATTDGVVIMREV